mgnify:CR=1 FL=1
MIMVLCAASVQAQTASELLPESAAKAASQATGAPQELDRCVAPASRLHRVNESVLRAILRVESRMVEPTISRNPNGSVDPGVGGTHPAHFPELARYGIAPGHLLDGCVATYVAAWQLARNIARYGNNMYGIAAYHSTTPYFNQRSQIVIYNELVRRKVIPGPMRPVPPLQPVPLVVAGNP